MNGLRGDLRAIFSRQQEGLGDARGTSEQLLRAAVVVSTLVFGRGARPHQVLSRPSPTPPAPTASPLPSPVAGLTKPLRAPATTPMLLFRDPANPDQVDGVSWDGSSAGVVGSGARSGFVAAPDGGLYQTVTGDLRDRSGNLVGSVGQGKFRITWAEDSRHYCRVAPQTGTLSEGQPPW